MSFSCTGLRWKRRVTLFISLFSFSVLAARAELWCSGYYPGWEQGSMPASNIDFTTLTHVVHFSVVPHLDGTLDSDGNSISPDNSSDVVSKAHAAGRKVLICVGGGGTETLFQGATTATNLPVFINSLTNFMAARGYDGIDIDWEPIPTTDAQQFTNLVIGLRAALDGFPEHKLLTAAVAAYPPYGDSPTGQYLMFAALQNQFDQLNIMTYDMSGPYDGWVTWFNSPIFDGGFHFPSNGALLPSLAGAVANFTNNGVASTKLGIGIAFYGYLWTNGRGTPNSNITQPRQSWTTAPTATAIRYSTILASYYQTNVYHWDTGAQAAYLSITNANPTNSIFLSYDDPRTCQAKVSFARNHALGGVMIWELAQDHQGGQIAPLMQAVKQGLDSPGPITIQSTNQNVAITFSGVALGSYRVQWTDSLTNKVWNTLAATNLSGPGQPLQIVDPNPIGLPQRFYRIQSPQ